MNASSISPAALAPANKVNLTSYLTMLTVYTVGIPVAVLLLITTFIFAFALCNRTTANNSSSTGATDDVELYENYDDTMVIGIDDDTLKAYPTVAYTRNSSSNDGCCSICLVDYKDGEVLRSMPGCSHLFHVQCVDTWLKSRPTCPVCRTSPLNSPVPTPLAEVVPLAQTVQHS
ncbi:RING-H2 finger protein ATL70-like [Carex rostrata]